MNAFRCYRLKTAMLPVLPSSVLKDCHFQTKAGIKIWVIVNFMFSC